MYDVGNERQLYLPEGFAHGFCVLSDEAEVMMMASSAYSPAGERTIRWNDPDLGIDWPLAEPLLSERDQRNPPFSRAQPFRLATSHQPPLAAASCFISHSGVDNDFAHRLFADLKAAGVPCWWAIEDMKAGERIRDSVESAIQSQDRMILVLSERSIQSTWVADEVESALEKEAFLQGQGLPSTFLLPLRLDDSILTTTKPWAAAIRRTRNILDFSDYRASNSYTSSFKKLLRALVDD